jgi:hypothetical protein
MDRLSIKRLFKIVLVLPFFFLGGCWKSEYEKLVEKEISSGVRHDSLFLGLYLGMPRKAFFDRCTQLNKKHLTTVGFKGSQVLYKLVDKRDSIYVHFFPVFKNDSIYKMPVTFTYKDWSPFLRSRQPDSLQLRVKKIMEKWYGQGFIKVERQEFKDYAFIKVDGNRQIVLFCDGEMDVKALYSNLLYDLNRNE